MLLYWILLPIVWVLAHILFRFKAREFEGRP